MTWSLLIYTIPSEPSRVRAAVWRALKQAGAVYLRDGVAVLPGREETLADFQAIAAKIVASGGQATLVEGARLDPVRAEAVTAQAREAREREYEEISRQTRLLLAHVAHEREHRELTLVHRKEIAEDLLKLRRWVEQVRARDHFATATPAVYGLLHRCEQELAEVAAEPARRMREAAP